MIRVVKFFLIVLVLLELSSCAFLNSNYSSLNSSRYNIYSINRRKIYTRHTPYVVGQKKYSVEKLYYRNKYRRASYYSVSINKNSKKKYKMAPYVVFGKRYEPMNLQEASHYKEVGIASWYGFETANQKDGNITANGESFYPEGLSAAHKLLPLPVIVQVTNLKNNKVLLVRVNDRGPFVGDRIIDLSAGAARRLGYYKDGTTKVLIRTIQI